MRLGNWIILTLTIALAVAALAGVWYTSQPPRPGPGPEPSSGATGLIERLEAQAVPMADYEHSGDIRRWHDPLLPVTCWILKNPGINNRAVAGISCLPDSALKE